MKSLSVITILRIMICMVAGLVLMTGCTGGEKDEDLADYGTGDNGKYVYITIDDKTFVPFVAVGNNCRGKQIGIVDGDPDHKIYEYKNLSRDEWIVDYYDSGLMDGSMLMREENVSDIPEGLESEYEWNQFNSAE